MVLVAAASIGAGPVYIQYVMYNTTSAQSAQVIDDERIWLPVIVFATECGLLLGSLCVFGTHLREEFSRLTLVVFLLAAAIGSGSVWVVGPNPLCEGRGLGGQNSASVMNVSREAAVTTASNSSSASPSSSSCQAATQRQSEADCIVKENRAIETEETSQCRMIKMPAMCTDLPEFCRDIDSEGSGTEDSRSKVCELWPNGWNHNESYATFQQGLSSFDVGSIVARYNQVKTMTASEIATRFQSEMYRPRGDQPWDSVAANGVVLVPNDLFDAHRISQKYGFCFSSMPGWPRDASTLISAIVGRLMCESTYKFCDADGSPKPTCPSPTRNVVERLQNLMLSSCEKQELSGMLSQSNFHMVFAYLITTMRSPASKKSMKSVLSNIENILSFAGTGLSTGFCEDPWYSSQPDCLRFGQDSVNPRLAEVQNKSTAGPVNECDDFVLWVRRAFILTSCGYVGFFLWSCAMSMTMVRAVRRRRSQPNGVGPRPTRNNSGGVATIVVVMVLSLFLSGVLLWARHLAVRHRRVMEQRHGPFASGPTEKESDSLESAQFFLLLSSLLIIGDGVVNAAATFAFCNADVSIIARRAKTIYERRKSSVPQATTGPQPSTRAVCANSCILYAVFAKGAFDAWFSLDQGTFYLELVFALEFVETVNQVVQLFVFSAMRPFQWVVGLCSLLMLNTAFAPAPFLVSRCGGSEFASRTAAAMLDLMLDALYLMLSIVVLNIGDSFAGDDWLVAVLGLVLPAFGALKTLHEIYVTTSMAASFKHTKTLLDSPGLVPSKTCLTWARSCGYLLTMATVATSVVFSSYFLVLARDGRHLCEAQMGEALTAGAFPLVVLDTAHAAYCDVSQIEAIDAPWRQGETNQRLRLHALPRVFQEMKRLKRIDVSGHNISRVPLEMLDSCSLPLLENVDIAGNPVAQTLDLSAYAHLKYIPGRVFDFFPDIQTLNVRNTSVSCLPKSVAGLRLLKRVDVEHCPIRYVSPNVVLSTLPTAIIPNASINLRGTPLSTRLDWSEEFTREESLVLARHLHEISEIFPDLEELNLAGNHLQFKHLPDFNRGRHLRKLNISRNEIGSAPWTRLQDMAQLEELDLSWNRLKDSHFQMIKDNIGITCAMLEQLRASLQTFDVRQNNAHYLTFGKEFERCEDISPFIEQEMLTNCPQGAKKVLLGIRKLVQFVLPAISGITYSLAHFSNGSANGCFPDDSEELISLGRGLTLEHIFEWADPKALRYVQLQNHPSGPLPSRQTLRKFQNLSHLIIDGDFRPGNLNADIYELKNMVKFSVRGFPDQRLKCVFDCFWPNASEMKRAYETGMFQLPAGLINWQDLQTFGYSGRLYIADGNITDLFDLPNIRKIELDGIYLEHPGPQEMIGLVKSAPSLYVLSLKSVRGPYWDPLTTWPDFSVLKDGTSLSKLEMMHQHFAGSNNTLQGLTELTSIKNINVCGSTGLTYPSPGSPLATELRTKVFNGPGEGGEMLACVSILDANAGHVGEEFQKACQWSTTAGHITSAKQGSRCEKTVVYGTDGQPKNTSRDET